MNERQQQQPYIFITDTYPARVLILFVTSDLDLYMSSEGRGSLHFFVRATYVRRTLLLFVNMDGKRTDKSTQNEIVFCLVC